jgi:hypothetical protein
MRKQAHAPCSDEEMAAELKILRWLKKEGERSREAHAQFDENPSTTLGARQRPKVDDPQ